MDRVGGVLPIKLRSEKTMQSKSGGKDKKERERKKCGYSLKQWNDQNDEGARAKCVAVDSTSKDAVGSLKLVRYDNCSVTEKENRKIQGPQNELKL